MTVMQLDILWRSALDAAGRAVDVAQRSGDLEPDEVARFRASLGEQREAVSRLL